MTDDSALHNNTNNNNNNNEQTSLREASRFDGDDEISVSSNRSTQSTLSHRLKLASRRGEERARHHHVSSSSSSSSVTGDKRRKKKSSKNKAVDMSAVVRNKARQFETTAGLSGDDASSAKSSAPSKPSVVDISLMEHEHDKKEKKKKKSESSDDNRSKSSESSKSSRKSKDRSGWDSGSLGSQLNPNKYTDAGYLSKTADGKFQKGLYLLRKSKYQMARELHCIVFFNL